jgi:orotate phosphoribosyltransferase
MCAIGVVPAAQNQTFFHNISMTDFRQDFLAFSRAQGVLVFGAFTLKSGRLSPYFFNTGKFQTGGALAKLGDFYAQAIIASGVKFDQLYGPAYKGIPLSCAIAIALAARGRDVPYSFNRKEAKDHGEGGMIVGAPLTGRVLIVDDVISAGTSVRESVEMIRTCGAVCAGVAITLDRMERGLGATSAVQEVVASYNIPVIAIATLNDVMRLVENDASLAAHRDATQAYRAKYGA